MRATFHVLLLGSVTLGSLGLASSPAEAQLLPWRRPRYVVVYSPPPVFAFAPAVSFYYALPAVSVYFCPPTVSYYHAPAFLTPVSASGYAPAPVPAPPANAYEPAPAAAAPSASHTSTSAYYQPETAVGPRMNVSIHENDFQPATINIFTGTTVVWHNDSAAAHTVTSDTGLVDSGTVAPGGTFRHTFNQPGTYSYHCAIHPQMRGTIVVQ
jgi:plastocyanin